MQFAFTEEQDQFRDAVARFCRDHSPTSAVRTCMQDDAGYDPDVWHRICIDLGLVGLHLPEDHGGAGFSPVELGIVMEEFGRNLMCAPYFASSVLAASAISRYATQSEIDELLPQLLGGERIAALAIDEQGNDFERNTFSVGADSDADGQHYTLSGRKSFVLDGYTADLLLVVASTDHGPALFAVAPQASGLSRRNLQALDPTRKLAEIVFQQTPARLLGTPGIDLTPLYDLALVALANEMVGGAQALLDSAVAYTKLRVQFGRAIGSFQAIKHRLADLLLEVEMAKSAAYQAAQALAEGESSSQFASLAKAAASEAYLQAGIACIQLHGGVGFTWENDTHLWFKRAKASEVFLGTPHHHRERMLRAQGL